MGCPFSSRLTKGGSGFNFFLDRRTSCRGVTKRLKVVQLDGPSRPLHCTHRPLICLMRTTSSVYCRVVSVRSTRGLGLLARSRAGKLCVRFFSRGEEGHVRRIYQVMASIGRRVTCLHSSIVNTLVGRYAQMFARGRRGVLAKRFRNALVVRVYDPLGRTCSGYSTVTFREVCHSDSILSVRLTKFEIVDALVSLVVGTIHSPRGTCSRLLVGHVSKRCGIGTPALCKGVRTILSCVSNVASMCTLSLCQGVGNGDLPTMWWGRYRVQTQ